MSELSKCELCGEPMPPGEEMFKFHGYSGPCPKPPLPKPIGLKPMTAEEWQHCNHAHYNCQTCDRIALALRENAALRQQVADWKSNYECADAERKRVIESRDKLREQVAELRAELENSDKEATAAVQECDRLRQENELLRRIDNTGLAELERRLEERDTRISRMDAALASIENNENKDFLDDMRIAREARNP